MVLDTQTNGAQLSAEEVLVDPTNTGLDHLAQRNLQFADRFRVLWDNTYDLHYVAGAYDGTNVELTGTMTFFKIYLSNLGIPVTTDGTTANVTNITDNSLHMIAIGSSNNLMSLNYISRIRFRG